jgi:hypothetical protein
MGGSLDGVGPMIAGGIRLCQFRPCGPPESPCRETLALNIGG